MKIEAVSAQQLFPQNSQQGAVDQASDPRRAAEAAAEKKAVEKAEEARPDSVALLERINELTEDGAYSVRFEKNRDLNEIVVKVVDSDSGDVIRQIPPEELLGLTKRLNELRGTIVNKQS